MSQLSRACHAREHDRKKWYAMPVDEIFADLSASKNGLDDEEIKKRHLKYGYNLLPRRRRQSLWLIFFRQFHSSLVYILLIAAFISFILKDYLDGGVILMAVFINVVLGFFEEYKAETSFSALLKVVVNYCKVRRDGHERQISIDQLVLGDIVYLSAGDRVPADLRLIQVNDLKVNEAPLTGESNEIDKVKETLTGHLILPDQINMVFMGTEVTAGNGQGIVVGTGQNTALGRIADLVQNTRDMATPLEIKLNVFSKKISYLVLIVCLVIFLIGLLLDYELMQIFSTSIAVAVSAIPEGLLIAVTVILARGMQRILKNKALVKNLLAAEVLGATSVICADKTGTLTDGEMRVSRIATLNYDWDAANDIGASPAEELMTMLRVGLLCNNAYIENPDNDLAHQIVRGAPTEKALLMAAANLGLKKDQMEKNEPRLDEVPFDSGQKYMMTLHKSEPAHHLVYLKGAPEYLLNFSGYLYSPSSPRGQITLTSGHRERLLSLQDSMSRRGLRVLACAYKKVSSAVKNLSQVEKNDFIFVGLFGLKDPLRHDIKTMMADVKSAGIRTVMITGDNAATASAIGREIGLAFENKNILSGEELARMTESDLLRVVDTVSIYARVTPEDKLKIIHAWQDKGEVVAMTGDGINDAPALKKANIGIAPGTATDVAKETADIILLDNNFATIVSAIKEGRVIFDNIKKVILYLLSNSFAEVIAVTVSIFCGWPLPLLASHIIWINLVTDSLPAMAMTEEPAEKNIMSRAPRRLDGPVVDRDGQYFIIAISFLLALGALFIFYYFWKNFGNLSLARTVSFTFLVLGNLFYIFSIRDTGRPVWQIDFWQNKLLLAVIALSLFLQLLVVYHPFFNRIFNTVPLSLSVWFLLISSGALLVLLIEGLKFLINNKQR